jgi:Protein of unknown function (DUF3489)
LSGLVSVAALDAVVRHKEGLMAISTKAKPTKQSARTSRNKKPATVARPPAKATPSRPRSHANANSAPTQTTKRSSSKQEAVLGMLRQPKGATVAAIADAIGWQQHSVRGFLAGVVKKKLKLKLKSEMTGDKRVYSIIKAGAGS